MKRSVGVVGTLLLGQTSAIAWVQVIFLPQRLLFSPLVRLASVRCFATEFLFGVVLCLRSQRCSSCSVVSSWSGCGGHIGSVAACACLTCLTDCVYLTGSGKEHTTSAVSAVLRIQCKQPARRKDGVRCRAPQAHCVSAHCFMLLPVGQNSKHT